MSIFEAVKRQIDIKTVLSDNNIVSKGKKISCLWHKEKTPSCHIYDNALHCYGCGTHASVIDLYMKLKNIAEPYQAALELAENYKVSYEKVEPSESELQEYTSNIEIKKLLKEWSKNLKSTHIQHLKSRGLNEQFIKQHQIGYEPNINQDSSQKAKHLGLISDKGYYLAGNSYVIPLWNYGDAYLAFYRPGQAPKYLYPCGMPKPLIGTEKIKTAKVVYLTEGVFDYFSLVLSGFSAVLSLGTNLSEEQKSQLFKAKEIIICFDGDETGRKAAEKLAEEMTQAKVVFLPDGKDLNDLFVDMKQEAFKTYIEKQTHQAKSFLEIILDELKQNPENVKEREKVINCISSIDDPIMRDINTEKLYQIIKTIGIKKSSIEQKIDSIIKARSKDKLDKKDKTETSQDIVIRLAKEVSGFKDEQEQIYVELPVNTHTDIYPISGRAFNYWLADKYYKETGKYPKSEVYLSSENPPKFHSKIPPQKIIAGC